MLRGLGRRWIRYISSRSRTLFPIGTIGGHHYRLHQFRSVHVHRRRALRAADARRHREPRPSFPGAGSRWPRASTNSSPSTVRSSAGTEGMRFFPFVFSLFIFVLIANLLGMIPGFFTVTSHIIVTFALAALVIRTVIVYGFYKNGTHFLNLFVPSGVHPADAACSSCPSRSSRSSRARSACRFVSSPTCWPVISR